MIFKHDEFQWLMMIALGVDGFEKAGLPLFFQTDTFPYGTVEKACHEGYRRGHQRRSLLGREE